MLIRSYVFVDNMQSPHISIILTIERYISVPSLCSNMRKSNIDISPFTLKRQYERGMSLNDIGKYHSISATTVRMRIAQAYPDFKFRDPKPPQGKTYKKIPTNKDGIDMSVVEMIYNLEQAGSNAYEIHEITGYSVNEVTMALHMKKYEGYTPEELLYTNPFGKTVYYSQCQVCHKQLPPKSKRKTCGDTCHTILTRKKTVNKPNVTMDTILDQIIKGEKVKWK